MAAPRKGQNPKAVLAKARLPERSVSLCVRGDLVAQLQDLQRQLVDAERDQETAGSLDGGQAVVLAGQIEALRDEMAEHMLDLTVRALPRRKWDALVAQHPAQEGNDAHRTLGMNPDTFFDALLRISVLPALDDDDWAQLEETLSTGQWQELNNTAWLVNQRDVSVPFSQRASRILASSAPE